MMQPDPTAIRLHEDPALFRESVTYTAAETGFATRVIEKDYFGSVLLQHVARVGSGLVFKGGTCLAKVHAGFYRLSEDLDFTIPVSIDAGRADRSRRAGQVKKAVTAIPEQLPGVRVASPFTGANQSTQYSAVVVYRSLLSEQEETIKLEAALREPLLMPPIAGQAHTLLRDPVSGAALVPVVTVSCLSQPEAMAEKLRAALTRRDPAIRDFYDVDHAVRRLGLRVRDPMVVRLVAQKVAMPGNAPVDVSEARRSALEVQVDTQLRAVLRVRDFTEFDLDRAFATVSELATALRDDGSGAT